MGFEYFDIFTSDIQFHVDKNMKKKGSFQGGVISVSVIVLAILYLSYLLYLYISNLIDPKFKMQIFISEDKVEIQPDNELIGFNYVINSTQTLSDLEKKQNQVYLQFIPTLVVQYYQQESFYIFLDAIDCTNEKLKGYKCIDFSKSEQYQLVINDRQNYNADLFLVAYRCGDKDFFKQTIPVNCAQEEDIDKYIGSKDAYFEIKAKVSQYNTTSEQMDVKYKRFDYNFQGEYMLYSKLKSMKQYTNIKKGPFIQSINSVTSIIDYKKEDRTFSRQTLREQSNINAISQIVITLDEQIQYVEIQYASFLEVLSIFNSTFAVLMGLGLVGKHFSKKLLLNEFKFTFMREFYCQSYMNLFKLSVNNKQKNIDKKIDIVQVVDNNKIIKKENINNNNVKEIQGFNDKNTKVVTNNQIFDQKQSFHQKNQKFKQPQREKAKFNNITNQNVNQSSCNDESEINENSMCEISINDDSSKYQNIQQLQKSKIKQEGIIYLNQKKDESMINTTNYPNQQYQLSDTVSFSNSKLLCQIHQQIKNSPQIRSMQTEHSIMLSHSLNKQINKQLNENNKVNEDDYYNKLLQFDSIKHDQICITDQKEEINLKQNQILKKNQEIIKKYLDQQNLQNASKLLNSQIDQKQIQNLLQLSKKKKDFSEIQNKQLKNIKNSIYKQMDNSLNIFNLYKDLLFLKKAVMVLLSDDQYATIKIIGYMNFESDKNNHINNLFCIYESEDLQIENQLKFFKRVQTISSINEIDERIISSLFY